MKTKCILTSCLLLLVGGLDFCEAAPTLYPANGHFYEYVAAPDGIAWAQARDAAATLSYLGAPGHLATITSTEENAFILSIGQPTHAWLGGFQPPGSPEPEGNWQWVTGEAWTFSNWIPGEPNNNGGEDALQIPTSDDPYGNAGKWNDLLGTRLIQGYMVEYEPPSASDPSQGLVAYYPLDGDANDYSGNGYNGVINGATPSADRFGTLNRAYAFSGGISDFITMPGTEELNLTNGAFTLCAWISLTVSNQDNAVVAKHRCDENAGYGLFVTGNKPNFFLAQTTGDNRIYGPELQVDGTWHFLVGTYDGQAQYLYVDGQLAASQPVVYQLPNSAPLAIGRCADSSCCPEHTARFAGRVDDVRIYGRALLWADIQTLSRQSCGGLGGCSGTGWNLIGGKLRLESIDYAPTGNPFTNSACYDLAVGHIIELRAQADPGYTIDKWYYNGVAATYPSGTSFDAITVQGPTCVSVTFAPVLLQIHTAIELRFDTIPGRQYQVQKSTDMQNWSDDGSAIPGDGASYSEFRSAAGGTAVYYRLRIIGK